MTIVWFILKLILYLLLFLCLMIVCMTVYILCMPIHYAANAQKEEHFCGEAKIKFLGLCKCEIEWENSIYSIKVTIINKTLFKKTSESKDTASVKEEIVPKQILKKETTNEKEKIAKISTNVRKKETIKDVKCEKQKEMPEDFLGESLSKKKPKEEKSKWIKMLKDPLLWQVVKQLGFMGKRMWKKIKPTYSWFYLRFGLNDPADTGSWIAKLTLLYPLYYSYGKIEGDYTKEGVWGNINLQGTVYPVQLVGMMLHFLIHKNTRLLIKRYLIA